MRLCQTLDGARALGGGVSGQRSQPPGEQALADSQKQADALAGQVVLVFQPKYSPELQPVERLWRQWRPNVTHNHTRGVLEELEGDSDRWLGRAATDPAGVLQMLGMPIERSIINMAA